VLPPPTGIWDTRERAHFDPARGAARAGRSGGARNLRWPAGARDVRIIDLNELGAKILAPSVLGERDASLQLEFALPIGVNSEVVQVSVAAQIKAIKAIEPSGGNAPAHSHGVQFQNVGERERLCCKTLPCCGSTKCALTALDSSRYSSRMFKPPGHRTAQSLRRCRLCFVAYDWAGAANFDHSPLPPNPPGLLER